jgi:hypothetical protein
MGNVMYAPMNAPHDLEKKWRSMSFSLDSNTLFMGIPLDAYHLPFKNTLKPLIRIIAVSITIP